MHPRALQALLAIGAIALLLFAAPTATDATGIDARFDEDQVLAGGNATLHVDGASGDTIRIRSPNMTTDRLAEVVNGTATTDGGVLLEVPEDGVVSANFDGFACRPGRYIFELQADGATATAHIDVVTTGETKIAFVTGDYRVVVGGTAEVQIWTACRAVDARVRIVGDGYSAAATLALDGPGTGTLRVDTAVAGDDTAPAPFAVTGNATLTNTTVDRDEIDPPLPAGAYNLSVSVKSEETDLAVLRVRAGTPSDTPTPRIARTVTVTPTPNRTASTGFRSTVTSTDTSTVQPGFGAVATLVALVAGFALVWRR